MQAARACPGVAPTIEARHVRIALVMTLLVALAAPGCSAHRQAKALRDWSGFLDDYSRLELGQPGDLQFVYRNPKAQWTTYDKVLIEPIALWRSGKHSLDPIPEEDLLRLMAHFQRAVRTRLGAGFKLVDTPQPGTLRLRIAITEAHASDPVVDVMTATPDDQARAGGGGPLGKELAAFIDAASIEGELRDATTGALLAQGIDRRAEGAPPRLPTWEALDRALAFWADQTCARLEARTRRR